MKNTNSHMRNKGGEFSGSTIGLLRLMAQHVAGDRFKSVKELVSWMGAMQAQDFASVKWAVGLRLPGLTEDKVNESINIGEIIRTHLLRPTWHIVTADDYYQILQLTAPAIRSSLKSRRKQLELDDTFFEKTNPALERILADGNYLIREELSAALSAEISNIDSFRMNHILLEAELDGRICSGKVKNGQHSFALTTDRINITKQKNEFNREEAMSLLAGKYFKSHGPATLSDFNWWSGLSMGDCRKALEMVKHELSEIEIEGNKYWYSNDFVNAEFKNELNLLPAFDEFIISYRDRSAVMTFEHHGKAVSDNGVFRPMIVYEGQVVGLWTKTIKKNKLTVTPHWFISPGKKALKMFDQATSEYTKFLGFEVSM